MSYKIPLFDLNYGVEEEEAVIRTLRSKWISMGPNVAEFEEVIARHLGARYAVAVTNCTAALHLAMKALNLGAGDEVIVPALSFVATANVIRYVGANPVFADIRSYEDFSVDPEDVARRVTSATKAIIVMHYGGFSCEMDHIMDIAQEEGIAIIEDAAHAPDSDYKGRKLGSIGDIGCFSFFSNKNISCAEGGAFVTNRNDYAEKAKLLRSHGMTAVSYDRAQGHATRYDVVELGYNYRLDDIRGALLLAQLERLDRDIAQRARLRTAYVEALDDIDEIIVPYREHPYASSNYIFPIVLRHGDPLKRDLVRQKLADVGIQTSVHYPAIHRFAIYQSFSVPLPKTEYVADNEITLPLYYKLSETAIAYIAEELKTIIRRL